MEIQLRGAGTVSARTPSGAILFKNRRIYGESVIDVDRGSVVLEASQPIERLQLYRYAKRAEGEIVIGPFQAHGVVTAEAVGHGAWTCEVGYDYDVYKELSGGELHQLEGLPPYQTDQTLQTWDLYGQGEGNHQGQLQYTIARRFDRSLPAPTFQSELECGKIYKESETVTYETPHKVSFEEPAADYWTGMGEWTTLSETEAPDMDQDFGYWTHVWGRISADLDVCYDLATGQRVSPQRAAEYSGQYLVKSADTQTPVADVDGWMSAYGEPMRVFDDPVLLAHNQSPRLYRHQGGVIVPPGEHLKMPYELRPRRFVIRAQGHGILRAIKIRVRSNYGRPDSTLTETVYREELSSYKDPDTAFDRSGRQPRSGAGVELPVQRSANQ
jgi:hypothetical protein